MLGQGTSVLGLELKQPAGSVLPVRNLGEPSGLVSCGIKIRNAVVGEVAVFHIGHGHGDEAGEVRPVSQSFICAEVKHLVGHNFSARGCAELVTFERRLGRAFAEVDVVEIISSVKEVISQEIVGRAMELVRAALSHSVDLSSATAVLGSVGVGLDFELLDFVYGGNSCDGIEVRRSVDRPVEKEIGVLSTGAADRVLAVHPATNVANFLE